MIPFNFGVLISVLCLITAQAAPLEGGNPQPRSSIDWLKGRAPPTAKIAPSGSQVTLTGVNAFSVDSFWGIPYAAPRKYLQ